MSRIFLFWLLFWSMGCLQLNAQAVTVVDSLKQLVATSSDDSIKATNLNFLAFYYLRSDFDQVTPTIQQALALTEYTDASGHKHTRYPSIRASSFYYQGVTIFILQEYPKALEANMEALKLNESIVDAELKYLQASITDIYTELEDFEEAEKYY
ncbi:MAG: hypothetical protein R2792_08690 [Saprospiraceae bacterium]